MAEEQQVELDLDGAEETVVDTEQEAPETKEAPPSVEVSSDVSITATSSLCAGYGVTHRVEFDQGRFGDKAEFIVHINDGEKTARFEETIAFVHDRLRILEVLKREAGENEVETLT